MSSLEKSILSTLVYYDVLSLPLTGFEVYKYLIDSKNSISFPNVLDALEDDPTLKEYLDQKNGFYFLKGRESIVWQRIKREKVIQRKWKKIRGAVSLLGLMPFIRMVALSGSIAVGNVNKASDIDLLIITKKGRIWTTRLLVTILLDILGKRRHEKFIKDRICLNHYITDESLKINFPSLYNAQTYIHLIPVLGDVDLFDRFQKENSWIKNWVMLGDSSGGENLKYLKPSLFFEAFARLGELVLCGGWGDFIERILARWQRKVIMSAENNAGKGRITIDDNQLEFHPDSPEVWIIEGYNRKMRELGFSEMARERDSGLQ